MDGRLHPDRGERLKCRGQENRRKAGNAQTGIEPPRRRLRVVSGQWSAVNKKSLQIPRLLNWFPLTTDHSQSASWRFNSS